LKKKLIVTQLTKIPPLVHPVLNQLGSNEHVCTLFVSEFLMCADVLPRFLTLRFTQKFIQICLNVSGGYFCLEFFTFVFYLKTSSLCVFMVIILLLLERHK